MFDVETATTKNGTPIALLFYEQDPKERPKADHPWVVHRVSALIEGEEIGYLKIAYIPRKRWDEVYPTPWEFLRKLKGMSGIDTSSEEALWESLRRYSYFLELPLLPTAKPSPSQIKKALRRWANIIKSTTMAKTKKFHVDKPFVDSIRVEEPWRRQGVGRLLYLTGAKEMARRGLKLHASDVQSEEAKASWRALELSGAPVKTKGDRKFLDFRANLIRFATCSIFV